MPALGVGHWGADGGVRGIGGHTRGICDQSSHKHGHKMSLPGGQVDILFDRQSASQPASLPAAIGQPTSHVTKYKPVRLWVGQIFSGRRTRSPTTLGPSPGS